MNCSSKIVKKPNHTPIEKDVFHLDETSNISLVIQSNTYVLLITNPKEPPVPSFNTKLLRSIAGLALFTFTFLGSEFFFDRQMGLLASAEQVVSAQAAILGASVVGFLAYAGISKVFKKQIQQIIVSAIEAAGIILCLFVIATSNDIATMQTLGCISFFLFGCLGAEAHWNMAYLFHRSPSLAKGAASAYAAGILLQFANNLIIPSGMPETITLSIGVIFLCVLCIPEKNPDTKHPTQKSASNSTDSLETKNSPLPKQPLSKALWSIALIVLLACMFSTLDNVITLADAQGAISVETWPRLLLAASSLVAGFLFDIRERQYMGFIMFAITALSAISILAVEAGASPVIGLIVFYLSSGFFVTFFTTIFLQLAPRMHTPQLWAGMGRAANNLCAFTISGASLAITQSNVSVVMIASLLLFVCVIVAFIGAGWFRLPPNEHERATFEAGRIATTAPSQEELQAAFIARCKLTPREVDILHAVTTNEQPLKQVAEDMGISLRMLQRHLTSIYTKTGTQTRAGLTRALYFNTREK